MEKIEAYQTNDGKKFFKKQEAQNYEDRLRYKSKEEEIESHLYSLLEIKDLGGDENGGDPEEHLCSVLKAGAKSDLLGGLIAEAAEMGGVGEIIDLIIDFATISDGVLLKTAKYAKKII